MSEINWDKMTVIPAESSISTYSLIEQCDIILTFGSTVAMEACFMKKPTIVAGRNFYEDMGGFFLPKSHEELCQWINMFPNCGYDLQKAYEASIKYAWYYQNNGIEYTEFIQKDYNFIVYLGSTSLYFKLCNIKRYLSYFTNKQMPGTYRVIRKVWKLLFSAKI